MRNPMTRPPLISLAVLAFALATGNTPLVVVAAICVGLIGGLHIGRAILTQLV